MGIKEEKQELDHIEREIRNYILQNQKRSRLTENQVVLAMAEKGICSRMTCLKKIGELKQRDIIEDIKAKQNNFSCLVIKNENDFILISKQLTEIESLIKVMSEPVRKLVELMARSNPSALLSNDVNFLYPYIETVLTMLEVLLLKTDQVIESKTDCQNLHIRIIDLITKLTFQVYNLDNAKNLLIITRDGLSAVRDDLADTGTKNGVISFGMVDRVIKMTDNFESAFLV
jgi:hypothetical protein